jgi:hypothetical protein
MKKFFLAIPLWSIMCSISIDIQAMEPQQETLKIYTAVENQTDEPLHVKIKADQAELEGHAIANGCIPVLVLKHALLPHGPNPQGVIQIMLSPNQSIVSHLLIQRQPDPKDNYSQFNVTWSLLDLMNQLPVSKDTEFSFSRKKFGTLYGWKITHKLSSENTRIMQLHLFSESKTRLIQEIEIAN